MSEPKIYTMLFSTVYPLYVKKAERKERTKEEVDEIICWLTGYTQEQLDAQLLNSVSMKQFLEDMPQLNPHADLIKGVVCGVRVEDVEDPVMRNIRYLDKLIDELAKGKAMAKILR